MWRIKTTLWLCVDCSREYTIVKIPVFVVIFRFFLLWNRLQQTVVFFIRIARTICYFLLAFFAFVFCSFHHHCQCVTCVTGRDVQTERKMVDNRKREKKNESSCFKCSFASFTLNAQMRVHVDRLMHLQMKTRTHTMHRIHAIKCINGTFEMQYMEIWFQ